MKPPVVYTFGAFRLDPVERLLTQGGRPISLTPKALDTLVVLVERHGHLVSKDDLFQAVWPDSFVEENNLAQHISALRRALGEGPDGPFIETVPKRGYRFIGSVIEERPGPAEPAARSPLSGVASAEGSTTQPPSPRPQALASWLGRWAPAAALSIVIVVVGGSLARQGSPSPASATGAPEGSVTRIAVLPFANLGSSRDESFVAGLTEEIASRLASLQQLAVPSSTTIAGYDRAGKTVREVGTDLGVQYIVEGSVRWGDGGGDRRVRVTPRLVRVADDTTVWTHLYDTPLVDLLGVQTDVAHQITTALQVAIDARERRALSVRPTEDSEAYLTYLSGLAFAQQGASDTVSNAQARDAMERAVARDPRFALAWSWLARVLAWQYRNGSARSGETREAAERAARTALGLAPGLPEAHLGMADVLIRDRDYEGARKQLEVARAGLPNSPEVWRLIGQIAERSGRWRESRTAYLRGFEIDPPSLADPLAVHYLHMRQYDEARRYSSIGRAANRSSVIVPDAWGQFSDGGDIPAARAVLESALQSRSQADGRVLGFLARLEWFDRRYERALELIARMDPAGTWLAPNFRYPAAIAAGQVYESMGRTAEARREFEAALRTLQARAANGEDYQVEAAMALALAGLERKADALRHAARAVELLPVTTDAAEGMLYLYVQAQVQSRTGDPVAAMTTLDRLFALPGFYNETWLAHEPWFGPVRAHPDYRATVARWSAQKGDAVLDAN
jgi:DNA-binding winged helix-turn-helix (wHTH) protein/TolB-like protein/tetratricopeptide (TPR) repeat protein